MEAGDKTISIRDPNTMKRLRLMRDGTYAEVVSVEFTMDPSEHTQEHLDIAKARTNLSAHELEHAGLASQIGFDIILCAGQSNMAGRANIDAFTDAVDPSIWQFGCYSTDAASYTKLGPMTEPIKMPDATTATGKTGPATWFGRAYNHFRAMNRRVLLVPVAVGGTSMVGGSPTWNPGTPGGTNYENAIAKANAAIAAAKAIYPSSRFVGTIWIQGETDGDNSVTQAAYDAALRQLISGFRSRISGASSSWFVIGGMVPEAISARAGYGVIRAAHMAVASSVENCAYVDGVPGYSSDNLHYTTHPAPRILGARMAVALTSQSAQNVATPFIVGTTGVGSVLRVDSGAWANFPGSFSYQWYRANIAIVGATGTSYTVVPADVNQALTCMVTASGLSMNGSATTASFFVGLSTYDFESDTVGSAPTNTTALVGLFQVVASGAGPASLSTTGKTMHTTTTTTSVACDVLNLTGFSLTNNQTLTWRRGEAAAQARDGFLLRGQIGSSTTYPSVQQGYLFQTGSYSGDVRIYRFDAGGATILGTAFALTVGNYSYFRASAIGSTLKLEYSNDGVTWNTALTVADTTYPAATGPIQYLNGFSSPNPSSAYVDNIVLS